MREIKINAEQEKVYGETITIPSGIIVFGQEQTESIAKIIEKVEQKTKHFRNLKFHKALEGRSKGYIKKAEKARSKARKKNPELVAELDEIRAKSIKAMAKALESTEFLPD